MLNKDKEEEDAAHPWLPLGINNFGYTANESTEKEPEKAEGRCVHDWVKYVGLNETYEFCTKCDEKKETGE